MIRLIGCFGVAILVAGVGLADDPLPSPKAKTSQAVVVQPKTKVLMPLTGLTVAKSMVSACTYRYPVGTSNAACQAFVDQGLGMYYSYVWIEAARAFETAITYDPECAYAWLMLSRSLEKWGKGSSTPKIGGFLSIMGAPGSTQLPDRLTKSPLDYSLDMAKKLAPRANHREQLLIQARLQEKGMWPDTPSDSRARKATQSLDELLTLYEDDQEAWFWRAQLAEGINGKTPFYKALLRINPDHPGANHELVHFYETIKRPALGWPFAEGYIRSSPEIPHAFHMQAHLATRIGKWGTTTDWSSRAFDLEKEYHIFQGVTPSEDHQFNHHMETLARSLVHDGRFYEANKLKTEADSYKYHFRPEWFRLAVGEGDWQAARVIVDEFRRSNKADGAYYAAQLYLEKGETVRAGAEIDTLRQSQSGRRSDKRAELRMWEVQGRYLCQSGNGEAGLKLLKKAVDATKADYNHHAWGNGAILMEAWGVGALEAGSSIIAEEAFQEALAHDAGSVRGALGMWAICQQLGRTEEASRYLTLARHLWSRADQDDFNRIRDNFADKAAKLTAAASAEIGRK